MVYGLGNYQFWVFGLLSAIAFFCSFYLPGSFFIRYFKLKSALLHIVESFILGISLWGAQGVIFGWMHQRWLTYVYLVVFVGLSILQFQEERKIWQKMWSEFHRASKLVILFIGLGSAFQFLATAGSGLQYQKGVEFFSTNSVDGLLHLSYIQAFVREFPAHEPGAVELYITNYHFWSDLVMAELVRIWQLPVSHLFFQYMPPLISILTGIATYFLVRMWKGSRTTGLWALFLFYMGGDAAYLFMLALHQKFGFYSPAIDDGVTQFLNVPHTFAKLVFLGGLIAFTFWLKNKKKTWLFLTVFLFSTLVGFKIYFGIFAGLGMSFVAVGKVVGDFWKPHKNGLIGKIQFAIQKNFALLASLVFFAAVSALIYFPTNKSSGGLLFAPLEWPKIFLGPEGLDFRLWWLRQQVYEQTNNIKSLVILDAIAIVICLISVYGTRLLGIYFDRKTIKKMGWEMVVFFFPTILIFNFLGLYTLQVSGLFNVFNFFAVSVVGLNFFAAFTLTALWERKNVISKIALALFVIFTIPRSVFEIQKFVVKYIHNDQDYLFQNTEIEALRFIETHSPASSIVQAHSDNEANYYTNYISFFSDRPTYLSGMPLLESHNQPIAGRKIILAQVFQAANSSELLTRTRQTHIDYIYIRKRPRNPEAFKGDVADSDFKKVFENSFIIVYQRMK